MSRRMMLDSGRPDNLRVSRTTRMTFEAIYNKDGMYGFYKVICVSNEREINPDLAPVQVSLSPNPNVILQSGFLSYTCQ